MRRRNVPHSKRLQPMTIISARSLVRRSSSALARSVSQKPGIARVIPRAVNQRGPEDPAHLVGELAEVRRVAVEIREIALVVKRPARRHVGDVQAVLHARDERAVRLPLGMKPGRIQRGLAVGQRGRLPGGILGVEGAADVHHVHAEAVEDEVLGLRELLDDVIDARARPA